jgi:hypothetical protein
VAEHYLMEIDMSIVAAYATFKKTFPKARKGDVVVIRHDTTSTAAKTFKRTTSSHYTLAYVTKAARDGLVKEFCNAGSTSPEKVTGRHYVCVIGDEEKRAAARDVATGLKDNHFTDLEALKAMIIDRAEALR